MPVLGLDDDLKLVKARVEMHAVRYIGQVEHAGTQSPGALIPLGGGTRRVAPGVRRIVEGPRIDGGPVQEIAARVVRVLIDVEDVGHAEFADREHPAVHASITSQPIGGCIHGFAIARKIDRVAYEETLQPQIRLIFPDLVRPAARKTCYPERVIETKALIDLRTDPDLGTVPQPCAHGEGGISRLGALAW